MPINWKLDLLTASHLPYGWSAGNLNRPIRIQQAGKMLVSWCKVDKSGKALKSGTFLTGDGVRYPRKGISNFKNHTSWQKLQSVNHFVFLNFCFGAKNARHGSSLVVRRVSQGRIIIVLFWTKYAVPRQFKPGVLKLTTSRGKRNLCTVFIFVSCEEKGCYRIVSLGQQNFDCRSYCGLSRRMQGMRWKGKRTSHLLASTS